MLNKLYIILTLLLLAGCGQNNKTSTKNSDMEPHIDNSHSNNNGNVVLTTTNDSIRDLYFKYLRGIEIPVHFEFPRFYIDTIEGKYLKLSMMEEDKAIGRLQSMDKGKRYAFIQDSLIASTEIFPEKKKLNYSYNQISKLKPLNCYEEPEDYDYFENKGTAKSKNIQSLDKNRQLAVDLNFVNERFSVPDIEVYILENIEVSLQNFNNGKWVTSDNLLLDIGNFALNCFKVIDYKPDDFILILFSGSNVGMIHHHYEYLVKLDIDKNKFARYEILMP